MPNPGRYFFHPHAGVQTDHGLYAPLIVDDPEEPGSYDVEQVVVLDDWTDGVGEDPDAILHRLLQSGGHGMGGMPGMQGAGQLLPLGRDTATSTTRSTCPTAGFPPHRTRSAPVPGQQVRLRLINAGSDITFRVGIGGHRMIVTHSDGFPVRPVNVDALLIAMGERYDAMVTLGDGIFPLVASADLPLDHQRPHLR